MSNKLIDNDLIDVAMDFGKWHVVSSFLPTEARCVADSKHLSWMKANTHRHGMREILMVLKGDGRFGYHGKVYLAREATLFLLDSFEPHDNNYPGNAPGMTLLLLYMGTNVTARLFNFGNDGVNPITKNIIIKSLDGHSLARTWDEAKRLSPESSTLARGLLVSSIATFVSSFIKLVYENISIHPDGHFSDDVIDAVKQYVVGQDGGNVSLEEAAHISGYSKFHFLRLFKKKTGTTFQKYVDSLRLEKARAMLCERCPKKQIADVLGFSRTSSFLRWIDKMEQAKL